MNTAQLIWFIAVTLLSLVNIIWQFDLQTRQRRLRERYDQALSTPQGTNLQLGLGNLIDRVEEAQGRVENVEAVAHQLQGVLHHSVQGVGMVRFRAFQDTGGDQSFAVAFVDGGGNGVVLSALYSREGTRIYGKPLASWNSSYNLSAEERQALDQARRMAQGG